MGELDSGKAIEVYNRACGIYEALRKNGDVYKTPMPSLETLKGVTDALFVAITAYDTNGGGKVLEAAVQARRAEVVSILQQLALYVSATANGDMEKLVKGGFPVAKQREPVGQLPPPETPKVVQGNLSGEARTTAKRTRGAHSFDWRIALASAPNTYVQTAQAISVRCTFKDLTPGEVYRFEVRALGAAGPSDYSNAATLRVI